MVPAHRDIAPLRPLAFFSISLSKSFSSSYCRTLYIIYAYASPSQRGFRTVRNSKFEWCLRKYIKVPEASPPLSPLAQSYMHSGGGHAELTWGRRASHSEQKNRGPRSWDPPHRHEKTLTNQIANRRSKPGPRSLGINGICPEGITST